MSTKPKNDPQVSAESGLRKGLTSYGDKAFSLFLRKAFIKGAGYTNSALDRPVIGIINTGSAYNPCHGNMPQLLEAVKRGSCLLAVFPWNFRRYRFMKVLQPLLVCICAISCRWIPKRCCEPSLWML